MPAVKVVFSDLDGTLCHFERHFAHHARLEPVRGQPGLADFVMHEPDPTTGRRARRRCVLLPTSTMGPGVMSLQTIELIGELRMMGVHFVYVTGARASTLAERLPLMARADAAFGETGGRFLNLRHDNGSQPCLDPDWTAQMEPCCGPVLSETLPSSPLDRPGALWDWARRLSSEFLFELDTRSYFFGFRVDLDKQRSEALRDPLHFERIVATHLPPGLATAQNLGKYDFFPAV